MPAMSLNSHVLCIANAHPFPKLACAMHSTCETETWPGMCYASDMSTNLGGHVLCIAHARESISSAMHSTCVLECRMCFA